MTLQLVLSFPVGLIDEDCTRCRQDSRVLPGWFGYHYSGAGLPRSDKATLPHEFRPGAMGRDMRLTGWNGEEQTQAAPAI